MTPEEKLIEAIKDPFQFNIFEESLSPEKLLLVALLQRALFDLFSEASEGDGVTQKDKRTAHYYFENPKYNEYGNFAHFCKIFDLNYTETKALMLSPRVQLIVRNSVGRGFNNRRNANG